MTHSISFCWFSWSTNFGFKQFIQARTHPISLDSIKTYLITNLWNQMMKELKTIHKKFNNKLLRNLTWFWRLNESECWNWTKLEKLKLQEWDLEIEAWITWIWMLNEAWERISRLNLQIEVWITRFRDWSLNLNVEGSLRVKIMVLNWKRMNTLGFWIKREEGKAWNWETRNRKQKKAKREIK
jgi:hypothetical protein